MKKDDLFLKYEKAVAEFKLDLIRRLFRESSGTETLQDKRTSHMEMAEKVLLDAGKPLHISEIIAAIEKQFGMQLDRDSLSSAIGKQIQKGKRFIRVAPNTFGLRQT